MAVTTGFHEFAFDLQTDPEGNFYFSKAAPVKSGGRGFDTIAANSGTVMKVYKDGKTLVNYATGFRAPNGIGVGPEGQVTSGDNEGTWMPKCRLNLVKPGGFYGVVDTAHRDEKPTMYDEPICWFPKDVDNSGGGQAWVTSDRWGPVLRPAPAHVVRHLLALPGAGGPARPTTSRGAWSSSRSTSSAGSCGRGSTPSTASSTSPASEAGSPAPQPTPASSGSATPASRPTWSPALKVTKTGLDLSFTDPVDAEDATDPDSYEIEQWNYLWCGEYGSDDYSAKTPDFEAKVRELNKLRLDPGREPRGHREALTKSLAKGHDEVKVESAKLSEDGKTISLEIKDLKPVMQMRIRGKLKAADGKKIALEVYNTINFVP